jgi:hypothetical protein
MIRQTVEGLRAPVALLPGMRLPALPIDTSQPTTIRCGFEYGDAVLVRVYYLDECVILPERRR